MSYTELRSVEQQWVRITSRANALRQGKQYETALSCYQQAMNFGELLLQHIGDAENLKVTVLSSFSVSCVNLAVIYQEIHDFSKASEYLFYNVWKLRMVTYQKDISDELHKGAVSKWQNAVLELTNFYKASGQLLEIDFWVDETYEKIKVARELIVTQKTLLN